jgi:hypothetical protein
MGPIDTDTDTCTTTRTFSAYGIPDGSALIRRTHRRLGDGPGTVDAAAVQRVGAAFRDAFLELAAVETVPEAVSAAVDDAAYFTTEAFDGDDADVRTDLVPSFYRSVAGFHCAYAGRSDRGRVQGALGAPDDGHDG